MLGNKDKLKLQAPPDVRYSNKNIFPIASKCPYMSKTASGEMLLLAVAD